MEVKGVGRRRTQLIDDLRDRRRYWELKEECCCFVHLDLAL